MRECVIHSSHYIPVLYRDSCMHIQHTIYILTHGALHFSISRRRRIEGIQNKTLSYADKHSHHWALIHLFLCEKLNNTPVRNCSSIWMGKLSSSSVLQLYSRCHCKHFSFRIFLFKCLCLYLYVCVSVNACVRHLQVHNFFLFIYSSFHVYVVRQQWISFQYQLVQMLTHIPSSETVKFEEKTTTPKWNSCEKLN